MASRVLLATAFLLLAVVALPAQTDYSGRKSTSILSAGFGASGGVTIPTGTSLPDSLEGTPGFSFRLGANIRYPFSKTLAGLFNFGIDMRQVGSKVSGASEGSNYNMSYVFLEPGVQISQFRVSMNIGLPSALSIPHPQNPGEQIDADPKAQAMLLEPRLGWTLPLMEDQGGWLGFTVDAGISLNSIYDDTFLTPVNENDIPGAKMLNIQIGATYQFGIRFGS